MRSTSAIVLFIAALVAAVFFYPHLDVAACRAASDIRAEQMLTAHLFILAGAGLVLYDDTLRALVVGTLFGQAMIVGMWPTMPPPMAAAALWGLGLLSLICVRAGRR